MRSMLVRLALCVIGASLIETAPAEAELRAYEATTIGGTDSLRRSPSTTPSVRTIVLDAEPAIGQQGPQEYWGEFFLEDDGGGTVTLESIRFGLDIATTVLYTAPLCSFDFSEPFLGTGIHVRMKTTITAPGGQTAPGSTAPGGQIDWGVITGFAQTGQYYCRDFGFFEPCNICSMYFPFVEDGTTTALALPSSSYDLGTWSFDANGAFEASPYIWEAPAQPHLGSALPGSNRVYVLRGGFFGASLPTIPLVGAGALSAALGLLAARRLAQRR